MPCPSCRPVPYLLAGTRSGIQDGPSKHGSNADIQKAFSIAHKPGCPCIANCRAGFFKSDMMGNPAISRRWDRKRIEGKKDSIRLGWPYAAAPTLGIRQLCRGTHSHPPFLKGGQRGCPTAQPSPSRERELSDSLQRGISYSTTITLS